MTTIACNGRSMAADTLVVWCGTPTTMSKMFETRDCKSQKWIVGMAGSTDIALACALALLAADFSSTFDLKTIDPEDKAGLIVLDPVGQIWVKATRFMIHVKHPFWAIGSGTDFALAGMQMGLDPEEAVILASALDVNTNDIVEVISL